ncbi:bifunctional riboflavin kinase/FAD synthetase [Desulfobotulus sp. H1]|uniref:Riboflavin biosynthesis protein n=1 Tax=Desulfobotulus pelophilus TaxID=2823377 RepID=A0ABT3N8G6_9BACT|nr:bifunctional riboflavin kinase/FAD synthetase [Desulfobotulus pelophilus]MCW7753745.1 bifunctional riboflavin kinase/FAD synthetase [Desulfobotulus pelophilus]
MQVIEHISEILQPFHKAVVSIGNFDGVHKGHTALFQRVREKADAIGGTAIGITFDPHPLVVIRPDHRPPLITMKEQKIELITATGMLDVLLVLPFDKKFATIPAEDFIRKFLIQTIGMQGIIVGPDYAFGRNREGSIELLERLGAELDFDVTVPQWITSENRHERISSTKIREVVALGNVEAAVPMLGRYYQVRGRVESGRQRGGRLLGFPTANIGLQDELCPAAGVYAVTAETHQGTHLGVANIGYSPTFDDNIFTVEVHILDFSENIYGKQIRINFIQRLRGEKKFSGIEALSQQIHYDIEKAREIFNQKELKEKP